MSSKDSPVARIFRTPSTPDAMMMRSPPTFLIVGWDVKTIGTVFTSAAASLRPLVGPACDTASVAPGLLCEIGKALAARNGLGGGILGTPCAKRVRTAIVTIMAAL